MTEFLDDARDSLEVNPHLQPLADEPDETVQGYLNHWAYGDVPERMREFEICEDLIVGDKQIDDTIIRTGNNIGASLTHEWMDVSSAYEREGFFAITKKNGEKYLGVRTGDVFDHHKHGVYRSIKIFAKMDANGRVVEPQNVTYDRMAEELRNCYRELAM